MADNEYNDGIQHGIDNNPNHDAEKGAKLGGLGGAVTGALAGSMAGPVGTVVGAVVGGVAGAIGSGVAVAAVDAMDNDNNISGVGSGVNYNDDHYRSDYSTRYATTGRPYEDYQPAYRYGTDAARNASWHGHDYMSAESQIRADYQARFPNRNYDHDSGAIRSGFEYGRGSAVAAGTPAEGLGGGNQIPGIQTGGVAHDGTPDTRGMTEKVADKLTGDHVDDKTGKIV